MEDTDKSTEVLMDDSNLLLILIMGTVLFCEYYFCEIKILNSILPVDPPARTYPGSNANRPSVS